MKKKIVKIGRYYKDNSFAIVAGLGVYSVMVCFLSKSNSITVGEVLVYFIVFPIMYKLGNILTK